MSKLAGTGTAGKTAVLACGAAMIVTMEFLPIGLLSLFAVDFSIIPERAGLLIAVFALSAGTVGPVLTLLINRWTAAGALAFCMWVFSAASIVAALWPDFGVMLLVRVIQGALLTPFIAVASAAVAATAATGQGGKAIGQINLGTLAGIVIGVPLAVALTDLLGWHVVFLGVGILTAGVAALIPHTLRNACAPSGDPQSYFRRQVLILRRKPLLLHLAMSGFLFTAMFAAYSYLGVYLEHVVGLTTQGISLALFGFGLAGLAGNWLIAQVVDQHVIAPTLVTTLVLVVATGALAFLGGHKGAALALLIPWGAAHAAAFLACQVRVMSVAQDAPAFAAALNIAIANLGIVMGAILGGFVIRHTGLDAIGIGVAVPGFLVLAIGVCLSRITNANKHVAKRFR
ncbi:MFS transporter [Roseinatronobacter sp. S2]|uniref:MFS transporter n=1 Tax=Roseinatronobacter sp. S2 TaxID=3035471 RepID=UPI00241096B8|nr:MFS transporter [Roseinatronobacter sp. S2]WFE75332.1 MFS transporter [Roseinatronobacter sp. S2]